MKRVLLVVAMGMLLGGFWAQSVDSSSEEDAVANVINNFYENLAQGNTEKAISYLSKDLSAGPLNYEAFVNALCSAPKKDKGTRSLLSTKKVLIKKITIDGDRATVLVEGKEEPCFLKKEGSSWKIVGLPVKISTTASSSSSVVSYELKVNISLDVPSKDKEIRRFEERKSSISGADIEIIKGLLNKYVQAIERKEKEGLVDCFSSDFYVPTEEIANIEPVLFVEFYLVPELLKIKKIAASDVFIKGKGSKAEIRFTESIEKEDGEKAERVKIFKLKKDAELWKIVYIPMDIKVSMVKKIPTEIAKRQVIKLSREGLEKLENGVLSVYYPEGKEAIARELLDFMVKASKIIEEKLGFAPVVPFGVLLHNYAQPTEGEISIRESGGVIFPIRAQENLLEDEDQRTSWIIPHEQTETAVTLKLHGLYVFDPCTRWIGDGIAEYLAYTVTRDLSRKQCKAILTNGADTLQNLMSQKTTYNLTQWAAGSSPNTIGTDSGEREICSTADGYPVSLSFWMGLVDKHGEEIIKDFLERASKLSTINNKNLIEVLSQVTGERDLMKQLSTANIADLKRRLDEKIQELEIE